MKTSKELNLKLTEVFPEIKDIYFKETSWQDGDETGSHVVYADVFVPFIKAQICSNNKQKLIRIFDFTEKLLELNDEYADEVIAFSVIETLLFDEDANNKYFIQFAGPNTLDLVEEIIRDLEK